MDFRISLRGEIDLASVPELLAGLQRAVSDGDSNLRIDCTNLQFIDSTGVHVLLEAERALAEQDRHLTIVNLGPGPRRLFETLGLSALLELTEPASS